MVPQTMVGQVGAQWVRYQYTTTEQYENITKIITVCIGRVVETLGMSHAVDNEMFDGFGCSSWCLPRFVRTVSYVGHHHYCLKNYDSFRSLSFLYRRCLHPPRRIRCGDGVATSLQVLQHPRACWVGAGLHSANCVLTNPP